MIILKSESENPTGKRKKKMLMIRNMVQIHDEQQSIQMTISHRDTHKNTERGRGRTKSICLLHKSSDFYNVKTNLKI